MSDPFSRRALLGGLLSVAALGNNTCLLIRGHGAVATGADV